MRFYLLEHAPHPRYSGYYTYGHKWGLPGVHCSECNATWATTGPAYPSVDLSHLSAQEQKKYLPRVEEDLAEFERLREQVRPLVPPGVDLRPGTAFGPLIGSAQGEFGPLVLVHAWELLMKREPLERLQAEGLRGLKGCRTELRFRKKNPPELLEMELLPRGVFHPDCLPERGPPPCPKCGRRSFNRPEEPILDGATLPQDLDLFRLAGIIGTERFVKAVQRLGYEQDLAFRELPVG
ncbi:double-CXXCG motif protein [Hyalangium sp.]|uniref:SitI6 family double-CXXCG motif immunity protein n=1 Tax=Hyalangium sp. TaxID=2028555 RepID=UPI002D30A012|nr:double-CXXCG motif protein [Hyalangium sp.]HYH99296.1 double-CXXCG motif protein [Hyalangium sp.]